MNEYNTLRYFKKTKIIFLFIFEWMTTILYILYEWIMQIFLYFIYEWIQYNTFF